jgi:glutathione S-transferase
MPEDIRIFSYLPNPRVWKSLITAELGNVELKVIGDKPMNLTNWLWDFDAQKIDVSNLDDLKAFKRESKRGFKGSLYKTDNFLKKHPFGTVPAGFNSDGSEGIFESNSIMRAVARSSKNTSLYADNDPFLQSRIDSFLDANLVFAREFQVYTLEIDSLNEYLYQRMTSAYLFYMDGIERALSTNKFIVGESLTIADISFVCDLAQFLRERDKIEIINNQGYELITLNFEKEFPNAYLHLKKLAIQEIFKELLLKYLEKVIKIS